MRQSTIHMAGCQRKPLRGKRKITLTEEGVLLRKRAEVIIELVEKTEQEISYDLKKSLVKSI